MNDIQMTRVADSSTGYRWVILGTTLYIVLVNVGMTYFVGTALSPFFARSLALDRQLLGAIFSVFTLLTGISGPLVAAGVEKFGPRIMLATGSVVVVLGALAMGMFVVTGMQALVAYGIVVGLGTGAGGLIAGQTLVARWFASNRGGAIAAVVASTSIGGVITAPLMAGLATHPALGWRTGWILLGILSAIGCALALLLVRDDPKLASSNASGDKLIHSRLDEDGWPLSRVLRTTAFWALILGAMGLSGANSFIMAHALIHLQDLGRTAADQATWLSIFTIAQFACICSFGIIGQKTGMRVLLALALTAQGAGVWLVQDPGPLTFIISAICAGGGFGGSMTALMAIPGEFYGMRAYSRVLGAIMPMLTISGAISALASGWIFDATGNYMAAAIGIEILVAAAVALLLIARTPQPRG